MSIAFIFWLLMLLWLLFGVRQNWPPGDNYWPLGGNLLLFILLFLLGWRAFGFPIQG